ncbi:hypothetical protein [Klebsiella pneumoniae]|uniref:hypothetical protein n=2 Tax=Bacteria TaxID=2 RepID=UPI00265C2CFC|nr:hypothetical protein [Klebsiella pneumoniae]MDO0645677.1 hypothetical protein [Klebsiella pneumoniae]
MTKSTITRERLAKIKSWRETYGAGSNVMLPAEEAEELARIALAAMNGEPFAYIIQDKYERERGVEGHLSRSHVSKYVSQEDINEHEITCIPLYRHAQPVPVVSADLLHTAASAIEDLLTTKDRTGTCVWFDLPFRLRSAANAQPAPVVQEVDADDNFYSWFGREWRENYQHNQYTTAAKQMLGVMAESAWKSGRRAAMLQAEPVTTATKLGNSPVIPDGYVMVPMRLTAENGAKGALSGEFSETKFVNCPECFGDDECETCDGSGRIEITVPVTWTTIKEIWAKGVEHFAAAPQEVSDA